MSLAGLLAALDGDEGWAELVGLARAGGSGTVELPAPLQPFVLAQLAAVPGGPVVAITATGREAEDQYRTIMPAHYFVQHLFFLKTLLHHS